jgi:tetratricopeptide (TPR) repeat protein
LQVRGLVALAEGTKDRLGSAAAAEMLADAKDLNLAHPGNAELLRSLVIYRGPKGKPGRESAALSAALEKHPGVADFHEIHGVRLETRGASETETRAAFERALEIDPQHERALLGLARLEAANGRVEAALALQAKAIEAAPEPEAPLRAKAKLLIETRAPRDAERALEDLLHQDPYDGAAAASLAALRRERGAIDDRTRELEARSARFGTGKSGSDGVAKVADGHPSG